MDYKISSTNICWKQYPKIWFDIVKHPVWSQFDFRKKMNWLQSKPVFLFISVNNKSLIKHIRSEV